MYVPNHDRDSDWSTYSFLQKQANVISSVPVWHVGQGAYIDLEHIYLVEIKRISKATWVVELAVAVE